MKKGNEQPKVLLIDSDPARISLLKRALKEFAFPITGVEKSAHNLLDDIEDYRPDIIVVGIDLPDEETLRQLGQLNRLNPHPVVMFAEKDTPKIIQKAIKAGVSAFIVDDIQPQRLTSIITVAMVRFQEQQSLKKELETTKNKLNERKLVEKAKGLLMKQRSMTEEEAYTTLRKMAMDKGQSIAVVAENIIDVLELLEI